MGKKIYLTAAGEELLRHARRIGQQLREAGDALAAIRGAKGGRLTLGVVVDRQVLRAAPAGRLPRRCIPEADLHLRRLQPRDRW